MVSRERPPQAGNQPLRATCGQRVVRLTISIHPTPIIESVVQLHPSVLVGVCFIIESGASIGPGCIIESCVRIYGATRMGRDNRVCHGATIGAEPQDLGYRPGMGAPLTIGDFNHFKEGVNISRGIKTEAPGSETTIS